MPPELPRRGPLRFALGSVDGEVFTEREFAGRVSILLFATSYDVASQALARHLLDLYRLRAPRLNAALVMLEPPKNVEICRSFRDVLELPYPVLMADAQTLRGTGPFGSLASVPAWVILRRDGSVSHAIVGALSRKQLEQAIAEASE